MGSLHRLLRRVFAGGYDAFVLKAGSRCLRAVDARATCDIEPLAPWGGLDEVLGKPPSRVRDLVNIAVHATTYPVDGAGVQRCVRREAAVRWITLAESFSVPRGWDASIVRQLRSCAQNRSLRCRWRQSMWQPVSRAVCSTLQSAVRREACARTRQSSSGSGNQALIWNLADIQLLAE